MIQFRKQNYSIRKYAIGTSSVLLGFTIFLSHASTALADENTTPTAPNNAVSTESSEPQSDTDQEAPEPKNTNLQPELNDTNHAPQDSETREEAHVQDNTSDVQPPSTENQAIEPSSQPANDNELTSPQNPEKTTDATDDQTTNQDETISTTKDTTRSSDTSEINQNTPNTDETIANQSNLNDKPVTNEAIPKTLENQNSTSQPDNSTLNAPELDSNHDRPTEPESTPPANSTNGQFYNATNTRQAQDAPTTERALSDKASTEQAQPTDDTLSSDKMDVTIDKLFPAVKKYTLKNGKTVEGQVVDDRSIILNSVQVTPKVSYQKLNQNTAQYIMDVQDTEHNIDATLTFELSVIDNTIDLKMTDLVNHNTDPNQIIKNFAFTNQSLVSVNSSQKDANLKLTKMSTNTMVSGDSSYDINQDFDANFQDYGMYGFVSNSEFSAGLWSNAQIGLGGNMDFLRVQVATQKVGDKISVGLGSTPWFIQPTPEHESAAKQGLLPHIKIAIAEDENNDGAINWQDGAIRYRDIMNNPYGYEEVPELVGYRIAMNFGSQAQNPFLKTLDGVKKFYLNTDGLGQSILLKGYGSEGHDSGHLDYANIGKRMGGAEDFNALLEKGADYGARFGIHINASETYPESKVFNPDLLLKNEDGSYSYGWNWLDQGFNINADYDLTHGRKERFEALKKIVGDRLDFVYVDVWGNGQSGNNTAWPSHQLAKELNDLGWRVGVEWGHGMEYDSTFQHWAADLTYGGYENKGINSEVARFIRNHQKDSWVGNYPSYSGAADFPLLGGYDMKDFEGWQGRNNYSDYIKNIFETNIPTKFLQHYLVMRIEHGDPVEMTANGKTIQWTPEMFIELQNKSGDTVTVERLSNDYQNDIDNYRSRIIRLNDRVVLNGDNYLIPWNWDADGKPLTGDKEKLYHWNKKGGTTTWTLPDTWKTNQVVLYQLTETGRKLVDKIPVVNGQVTLQNISAETPYVLYQSEQPEQKVSWSEGMHIHDSGFNSQKLDHWNIQGDASKVSIVKSVSSNEMLKFDNVTKDTAVTQQLTNLEPGKTYALYVGIDNRSDAKAHAIVSSNGKIPASNQTGQSIAKNYVKADAHNTSRNSETFKNGDSYFQNMYVFFTAPESGNVSLTLARDAGEGATYFDDVRIVNTDSNLLKDGKFHQDFENVPQGLFPFVVSEAEGVEDNRIHLSELNAPYTQRGWNNKLVSDVIDGKWSLKVNGQTGKNKMLIQTIPQNFYFEPGRKYKISFDYESGSDDTYAFATGNGDISKNRDFKLTPLKNTIDPGAPQRVTFEVTGAENGLTWIGIYSTDKSSDPRGEKDQNRINFEGTKDFILDNLTIEVVPETNEEPAPNSLIDQPNEETPLTDTSQGNDTLATAVPNDSSDVNNGSSTDVSNNLSESNQTPSIDTIHEGNTHTTVNDTVISGNQHQDEMAHPNMSNHNVISLGAQEGLADTLMTQNISKQNAQSSTHAEQIHSKTQEENQLPETGQTAHTSRTGLLAMITGALMSLFAFRHRRHKQ
ncbi:endo-alpha-N-acetylgalactosaminidase family protein [Staphylococcus felis]|uniref:endo-alpha-N-acetylgalactosaminidase family protein n=1 Tax=Staphylococcus felis TaxID=46127 RepID=UPI000E22CC12|nr:endo-alpha-N-acetylgalactosaminidase family protein [Staphylococcus felis]REH79334.1 glycoside hydrolase [Staphylococcus felis]